MSELLKRFQGRTPKIAIVLGSSLGSFADAVKDPFAFPGDLTGFPIPKISDIPANSLWEKWAEGNRCSCGPGSRL
jgi:hypothetical protein